MLIREQWPLWRQTISHRLYNMNLICFLLSFTVTLLWGCGDFLNLKLTGRYRVGFKLIYNEAKGNPINVFYPMDNKRYETDLRDGIKILKPYLDYKEKEFISWMNEANRCLERRRTANPDLFLTHFKTLNT